MPSAKTLIIIAAAVVMLTIATIPALAQLTNHSGKGATVAGSGVFEDGTGRIECASAKGIYTNNATGSESALTGIAWVNCKILGSEAPVSCPKLTLEQPTKMGPTKGVAGGKLPETCFIEAPSCKITLPSKENQKLKKITLEKVGANQEDSVEIEGITATAVGSLCNGGGVPTKSTTAKLEVRKLVLEGVGLE